MKRSQLIFSTISLPIDYFMLLGAGLLAYELRFESFISTSLPVRFELPLNSYIRSLTITAAVWLILFAVAGLYNIQRPLKFSQELGKIFLSCTAGLALIIILFFFNPNLFNSRFIVLAGWLFSILLVSLGRLILRLTRTALYRRGIGVINVLLIGKDAATLELEKYFITKPQLGFKIVKRVDPIQLDIARDAIGVDEVLVGDINLDRNNNLQILEFCLANHLGFKYVADMFEAQSHNVVSHTLAGLPVIEIKRTALDGWGRVLKRLFDIIIAVVMLIILSPLLLLLAILIIIDSGPPILVKLERVGEAGSKFQMFKFRSMIKNAAAMKAELMPYNERSDGPLFKMTNDPRITRVGRFLRRTSFDELPQLWNVIKGQMSLVGPRPHEPNEVAKYELRHRKLLNIKPGMTGLAQISGRSGLSWEEEVRLDMFYVENWSINHDILILMKTLIVIWQKSAGI